MSPTHTFIKLKLFIIKAILCDGISFAISVGIGFPFM